ncbi:MAG: type II CRISPR-associated endonuclease Cas1 [Christensenellales bacterium]
MSWRTVVINTRCKLETKLGYMVARGQEEIRIHLSEIAVLIIESTAVSLTVSLLNELLSNKIKVIFCDERHNPESELCPIYGRYNSSGAIKKQLNWSDSIKALVHQRIVSAKIRGQAYIMKKLGLSEWEKLLEYAGEVQADDATNREGHAAKVYFNRVFESKDFSRRDDCPQNSALNYGYAILLSAFNREIAAKGLLTQIGIWHRNEFNQFNLSCDLMEPFRVYVDDYVISTPPDTFDTNYKHSILNVLNTDIRISGERNTLLNSISLYVNRVTEALEKENCDILIFPQYDL